MRTADALAAPAFLELVNRAYSDYFLPLHLDGAALRRMVEVSDLRLEESPLADVEGAPAGFALLGVRREEGWVGGLGVVPEARRRGLGRALMEAAIDRARSRGVRRLWLEVLEQNAPAVQLYRQLGFEPTRELDVWSLAGEASGAGGLEAVPADVDDAHGWIAAHRPRREPWQRADETLAHLRRREPRPAALAVQRDGKRQGALVHAAAQVLQLAAAGDDEDGTARALLEALRRAEGAVRWLNAPAGEPGSRALEALGAQRVARQHELVLALSP